MPISYEEASEEAVELAMAHRRADDHTTTIKLFYNGPQEETVRMLEVTASVPVTGEILPFRFNADIAHGVPYPSEIILVNPLEWQDVQEGRLELPQGWNIQDARDI